MDTPITPRRSIPTELKPRLRYRGVIGNYVLWSVPRKTWCQYSESQRYAIIKYFGRYQWCGSMIRFLTRA